MVDISFTMILQWIIFGILFFLLTKLLYRPLLDYLDRRRNEVEATLKEADRTRQEAEDRLEEYRKRLAGAEEEGREIKFQARAEGQKEREEILSQARLEASRVMERGRQEIDLQEKKARARLRKETVDLSINIAEKLMVRKLDREEQRKIIQRSIHEMEEMDA
jgi:F-type H+-transporting ATPase subunit b